MRWLIAIAVLAAGPAVLAEEAGKEPVEKREGSAASDEPMIAAAKKLLVQYLDLVKKKKWADARKLVHPKTIEQVADIKKRTHSERHAMEPHYWEKCCFYLKNYIIDTADRAIHETVVINVKEDNWQVEEKGLTPAEPASYLLGVHKGKWYVTDKMQNAQFNEDGIKIGHKGYFDGESKKPEPQKEPEPED